MGFCYFIGSVVVIDKYPRVSDASPDANRKRYSAGFPASRIDFRLSRSRRSCFTGVPKQLSSTGSTTPRPGAVVCVEPYNKTLCLFIVCRNRTVHPKSLVRLCRAVRAIPLTCLTRAYIRYGQ